MERISDNESMFSIFAYAFHAIAPILLLVLIGYYLRVKQVFPPKFFKDVNRFAFHYCFPALMFVNLYSLNSIHEIDVRFMVYLMLSLVVITVIGIILANIITDVPNRKGVLIQAGFRSNFAVIGLSLTEGLVGPSGGAAAAAMQAPVVIYFNIAAVLALTVYSDNAVFEPKKVLKNTAKNPLIQGLSAGVIALLIRECIPVNSDGTLVFSLSGSLPWLYDTIESLSRIASPLCLVMLGGQFNFADVKGIRKELSAAVLMRLILAPVLGFSMAFAARHFGLLDMTPTTVGIMIAAYGSPIAIASSVMASEMHADDILAGQIVVWTSLLSVFTIFFMAVIFRSAGML